MNKNHSEKWVYHFNDKKVEGMELSPKERVIKLGLKGANLHIMKHLKLPIPPGFVLSRESFKCADFRKMLKHHFFYFKDEIIKQREFKVSVRSSSKVSMPGILQTVFDIDNFEDLYNTVLIVENSWNSKKAIVYRRMHNILDSFETAVVVQKMVYGNIDNDSGTGVLYSKNPKTGEDKFCGEYLIKHRGVEIVTGTTTPVDINHELGITGIFPEQYRELKSYANLLEDYFKWPQDIEWTIEKGKLWLLQTRFLKLSDIAKIRILYKKLKNNKISKEKVLQMVTHDFLNKYETEMLNLRDNKHLIGGGISTCEGISACRGIGKGEVVFTLEDVKKCNENRVPCILIKDYTSTDDVKAMSLVDGIVTRTGGETSHAATLARSMNKPCIVGIGNNWNVIKGLFITIDATNGKVYEGFIPSFKKYNYYAKKLKELLYQNKGDESE